MAASFTWPPRHIYITFKSTVLVKQYLFSLKLALLLQVFVILQALKNVVICSLWGSSGVSVRLERTGCLRVTNNIFKAYHPSFFISFQAMIVTTQAKIMSILLYWVLGCWWWERKKLYIGKIFYYVVFLKRYRFYLIQFLYKISGTFCVATLTTPFDQILFLINERMNSHTHPTVT